jgi:hypothetical protein
MFITIRDFSLHRGIRIILECANRLAASGHVVFLRPLRLCPRTVFLRNNLVTSTNAALGISADGQPTEIEGRDFYNLGTGLPPDSTPQLIAATYAAAVNGVDYAGTFVYPHPLVAGNPSPTPTPTPAPTPTPTPTPSQYQVPNFIGTRLNHARSVWNNAGFTTSVTTIGRRPQLIIWQSLPQGFIGSCSDTTIVVQ